MKNEVKLYEAFGEFIYLVAMADGKIQPEELQVITEKLAGHPWGEDIRWSFDYEVKKERSIEELYKKVITYCEMHGPEKEYAFLIEVVEDLAKASDGINENERSVMNSFTKDLTDKFRKDLDRINGQISY